MNRREFIKSIGAAGVAACVLPELSASPPVKPQTAKVLICEANVPQPSGSIYSRQVLEAMACEHDGKSVVVVDCSTPWLKRATQLYPCPLDKIVGLATVEMGELGLYANLVAKPGCDYRMAGQGILYWTESGHVVKNYRLYGIMEVPIQPIESWDANPGTVRILQPGQKLMSAGSGGGDIFINQIKE